MIVENKKETINRIVLDSREIILIGTAHVSHESVDEVKNVIEVENPDRVCIEIDEGRYNSIIDSESWKKIILIYSTYFMQILFSSFYIS